MGLHLGVLRIPILKAAPNFFQGPFYYTQEIILINRGPLTCFVEPQKILKQFALGVRAFSAGH